MEPSNLPEGVKNLYDLDDLTDYQVVDDDSDIRGWDVIDADKRMIGKVDNLLVDKRAERVVFLDVEIDPAVLEEGFDPYRVPVSHGVHEFLNREGKNHLIIPIGMVILNEEDKTVITSQVNSSTFAAS